MRTIGIGIVIVKEDKILLGIRGAKCRHGFGYWALPGGRLEDGESIEKAMVREVEEECGLTISFSIRSSETPVFAVTDHHPKPHFTFWTLSKWVSGEPIVKEPDKCERWEWKTLREIEKIPGVYDPQNEAYYWLPFDLFAKHLSPVLGESVI